MMTIIDTIFTVGQRLLGLRDELAKAKQARKAEVSEFLGEIAVIIEETSASLKQGLYPHGKCQELLTHARNMEAAVGDLIGQEQAGELGRQLKAAWEVERLYGELGGVALDEQQRKLGVLDQAAGFFRATAAFVRVSP